MSKARAPKFDGAQALLPFRRPRSHRSYMPIVQSSTPLRPTQLSDHQPQLYDARQTNFLHPLLHKGNRAQTLNRSLAFGNSPPHFWHNATAHIELSDARRCQDYMNEAIARGAIIRSGVPQITVRQAAIEDCLPATRRGMLQVHFAKDEHSDTHTIPAQPLAAAHFAVRNGELLFESGENIPINLSKNPSVADLTGVLDTLNQLLFVSTVQVRHTQGDGTFVKTIFYAYRGQELVPFANSTKGWRLTSTEKNPDYLDFVLVHPDGHEFSKLVFIGSGTYDADAFASHVVNGFPTQAQPSSGTWGLKLEQNDFDQPAYPNDRYARERVYLASMVLSPE